MDWDGCGGQRSLRWGRHGAKPATRNRHHREHHLHHQQRHDHHHRHHHHWHHHHGMEVNISGTGQSYWQEVFPLSTSASSFPYDYERWEEEGRTSWIPQNGRSSILSSAQSQCAHSSKVQNCEHNSKVQSWAVHNVHTTQEFNLVHTALLLTLVAALCTSLQWCWTRLCRCNRPCRCTQIRSCSPVSDELALHRFSLDNVDMYLATSDQVSALVY